MRSRLRPLIGNVLLPLGLLLVVACGSEESSRNNDTDTGDTSVDSGGDTTLDTDPDTTTDTGGDAEPDTSTDIGSDTEPDTTTDTGGDVEPDTTDVGVDVGDPDAQLCGDTGGTWDTSSCGHYYCGQFPECDAIIPGCDCGPSANFDPTLGCVEDAECGDPDQAQLCDDTGGMWDPGACGHYQCGVPNACEAIIPGCNCGPGENFDDDQGCVDDDICADDDEAYCVATGGQWLLDTCGDWACGGPPLCAAIIPGCRCGGDDEIFVSGEGCRVSTDCVISAEEIGCEESGGTWDESSCGHYVCGEPGGDACDEPLPGCDCGPCGEFDMTTRTCVEGDCGCEASALCEDTGGTWDDGACGHYYCGSPNDCEALIPGCDCGADGNFDAVFGCAEDPVCTGQDLCERTGGEWYLGCGDTICGEPPPEICFVPFEACDCGPGMIMDPADGCVVATDCDNSTQELCEDTGGAWLEAGCSHYVCGEPDPTAGDCAEPSPSCNCGTTDTFDGRVGCVSDLECGACPDPRDPDVVIVSDDPEVCAVIDYACEEGYDGWGDNVCGCGCVRR